MSSKALGTAVKIATFGRVDPNKDKKKADEASQQTAEERTKQTAAKRQVDAEKELRRRQLLSQEDALPTSTFSGPTPTGRRKLFGN